MESREGALYADTFWVSDCLLQLSMTATFLLSPVMSAAHGDSPITPLAVRSAAFV